MLQFVQDICKVAYTETRKEYENKIVKQLPFSSKTKKMTTVIEQENGTVIVHSKGAAEIMLESCQDVYTLEGKTIPLTPELKK